MAEKEIIGDGATAVGIAWIMKECFVFLLKFRKQEQSNAPQLFEDPWREYCRDKFEQIANDIRDRIDPLASELREVRYMQELLRNQIQDIKMEHGKCLGKD